VEQLDLGFGYAPLASVAHQLDEPHGDPLQDDGGEDDVPLWGMVHLQLAGKDLVGVPKLPPMVQATATGFVKLRTISPVEPDIKPRLPEAGLELISNAFQCFSELELAQNDPGNLSQDAQLRHTVRLLYRFLFRGKIALRRVNRQRHQLGDRPSDLRPMP